MQTGLSRYKLFLLLTKGNTGRILRIINRGIRKMSGNSGLYDVILGRIVSYVSKIPFRLDYNKDSNLWDYSIKSDHDYLISVIVPCYNHEQYLEKRLDTIYNQTYDNFEVILLDDFSSDHSQQILLEYYKRYSRKTRICFNNANSGRPFAQWKKGLEMAKGELIWIAETDDWCELNFLEEMVKPFNDESIILAYSNMRIVSDDNRREHFLNTPKTYTVSSATFVQSSLSFACVLNNVSGTVFRKPSEIPDEIIRLCGDIRVASDWLFYLWILRGGCIAHVGSTSDYHLIHQNSTSFQNNGTENYFLEHMKIAEYIANNYHTHSNWVDKYFDIHEMKYERSEIQIDFDSIFDKKKLSEIKANRRPNIAIACYSLQPGGGETFPLFLANDLYKAGYTVTVIDFNLGQHYESIRDLLISGIPLIRLKEIADLGMVLYQINCDIVHSHHASVDKYISDMLISTGLVCRHVITLHGMYENLSEKRLSELLSKTMNTCRKYIYLTPKNLKPFIEMDCYLHDRFVQIGNGLPDYECEMIDRSSFGIDASDFVFCVASRGIREKGWEEAIIAVKRINTYSRRKVHLIIIGDGVMISRLEHHKNEFIHFTGVRNDVKKFFSMADAGLLPSYYKGESFPLMIIECLQCEKPVIASDLAEIPNMIKDASGNMAGMLVSVNDFVLNEIELEQAMYEMIINETLYHRLKSNCRTVKSKFDMKTVSSKYWDVYSEVFLNKITTGEV